MLGLLTALIIGVFTQPTADEIKTCVLFSGASGAADYKSILMSSVFQEREESNQPAIRLPHTAIQSDLSDTTKVDSPNN